MTKRINNIYPRIYNEANIELADNKARKCKRTRYGVRKHDEYRELENLVLHIMLRDGTYKTSRYTTYKIYEPKERVIFRLPYYPDRITHHAIMNIMEPIWVKIFTRDTYSCIKGRGIHALLKKLRSDLNKDKQGTKYCLKMDIKKFYPSINHSILKQIIRKKLKDKCLLALLDEIIDSADGVPIGNYLSQFFANLYLAYFDHWVKEELKVKYYYRYADDIVLLSDSKQQLRSWLLAIKMYLRVVLNLKLKDNYQIFPVDSRGVDFVGYVCYHNYTKLRKSIKKKMLRTINSDEPDKTILDRKLASYFGWLKYCNSKNLLKKIYQQTGVRYSGWNGGRVNVSSMRNKNLYIVTLQPRKRYFLVQFVRNGRSLEFKSSSKNLFWKIASLPSFPAVTKINNHV